MRTGNSTDYFKFSENLTPLPPASAVRTEEAENAILNSTVTEVSNSHVGRGQVPSQQKPTVGRG